MMADHHVLRIRRSDVEGDSFVIVQVSNNGSLPLEVKLVGTEEESVYVGSIKQKKLRDIRAHNYQGTDHEWEAILSKILLQKRVQQEDANAVEGLETVASIDGDNQISIIFRKNIGGITQRLGTIVLQQDEEQEISLFECAGIAAQAASDAQEELTQLSMKLEAQQDMINKLNAQLEDLLKAKQNHENELLLKFSKLLNSKKLKIRDQQRLLAGAKVDPVAAEQVQSSRSGTKSRKAGPSRTSKRKANGKAPAMESESEGFDEVDQMQVDGERAEAQRQREEEELDDVVTPEKSDLDETEDEDGLDAPAPSPQAPKSGVGSKGKAVETAVQEKGQSQRDLDEPPPRRELPFTKRELRSKPAQKPAEPVRDDDETDDDEL